MDPTIFREDESLTTLRMGLSKDIHMALKPLQALLPIGQFDGDDSVIGSLKGGEVVTFATTLQSSSDKAAKDAFDGYTLPATPSRPFVTRLGEQSTDGYGRPLMLADEGIAGYGTLFGSVVGGVAGQVSTGAVLGPHTSTGSGKVTCWAQPGLYAITIDTLAASVQPTTSLAVGAKLYATVTTGANAGIITAVNTAGSLIGNFVEFMTNGSLVSTPASLVGTFNPPDGSLSGVSSRQLTQAVIFFNPNSI